MNKIRSITHYEQSKDIIVYKLRNGKIKFLFSTDWGFLAKMKAKRRIRKEERIVKE